LFHESLFSFVLPFVWFEKKHSNKIFIGLCKDKVCWFFKDLDTCSIVKLSQQHFRPSLARGCYSHIPLPLFAMTTRKNDESIEHPQRKKKKVEKVGPSSDVYMLGYHVRNVRVSCFPNMIP